MNYVIDAKERKENVRFSPFILDKNRMNQSLTNLVSHSINDIHLFRNYEICQQESQCYLLIPPPRPPMFPKFLLPHPSSHHQWTDSFFIIFGLFISLTCTCLLLFLLNLKYERKKSFFFVISQFNIDFNFIINYNSVIIEQKIQTPSMNLHHSQV